jgi:hypothetical protein
MYVSTNSALVWKRMADENQQSARMLAKVAVALAAMILLTGAYAFTTNVRYGSLCKNLEVTAHTQPAPGPDRNIASTYCG